MRLLPSAATTCPCGSERSTVKTSSCTGAATALEEHLQALDDLCRQARQVGQVRFLTLPWCRNASRSRTAGGEFRLRMASMYMAPPCYSEAEKARL